MKIFIASAQEIDIEEAFGASCFLNKKENLTNVQKGQDLQLESLLLLMVDNKSKCIWSQAQKNCAQAQKNSCVAHKEEVLKVVNRFASWEVYF